MSSGGRRLVVLGVFLAGGCSGLAYRRAVLPPLSAPAAVPTIDETHRTVIDAERVQLTRDYLAIHDPELAQALPPGSGEGAISFVPRVVVVHFTAIPTLSETLATFAPLTIDSERTVILQNGRLNVGIQFVVDRDGTIYRLYPETVIARHVIGLNQVAIGIENVGTGDLGEEAAEAPLTEAQLVANAALIRDLAARHPTIRYLIGHSEYRDLEDPRHPAHELFVEALPTYRTEKVDPGRRFMHRLRRLLSSG